MSINTRLIHIKDTLQNNRHASRLNTLSKYILKKYLDMEFHHKKTWTISLMCLDYNPKAKSFNRISFNTWFNHNYIDKK